MVTVRIFRSRACTTSQTAIKGNDTNIDVLLRGTPRITDHPLLLLLLYRGKIVNISTAVGFYMPMPGWSELIRMPFTCAGAFMGPLNY